MIDLDQLKESWPIIGGFVAGVLAWGRATHTISRTERRVDKLEEGFGTIRETLARIDVHQQRTRESLDELVREIRERR